MKNFLHHLEYEESGLGVEEVKKIMSEKKIFYDHNADKREKKWSAETHLVKADDKCLPNYIIENMSKYRDWLD